MQAAAWLICSSNSSSRAWFTSSVSTWLVQGLSSFIKTLQVTGITRKKKSAFLKCLLINGKWTESPSTQVYFLDNLILGWQDRSHRQPKHPLTFPGTDLEVAKPHMSICLVGGSFPARASTLSATPWACHFQFKSSSAYKAERGISKHQESQDGSDGGEVVFIKIRSPH